MCFCENVLQTKLPAKPLAGLRAVLNSINIAAFPYKLLYRNIFK